MIAQLTNLNWAGVLLAFLAYSLTGALWFTVFFTRQYKTSLGRGGEVLQNKAPIFMVGPVLCTLAITITAAVLIAALRLHSLGQAVEFGLLTGTGFLVANTVNIAINPNMPRPLHYAAISGAYHITGILIASVILTLMN